MLRFASEKQYLGQRGRDSFGKERKQRDSKAVPPIVWASDTEKSPGADRV